jgi:N-acetylneuraminic acid mutarotase
MRTYARPSPPAAVFYNDVYRFSAAANTWTALSPTGSGPSPRVYLGFAATPDGMLYVFGGTVGNGGNGRG